MPPHASNYLPDYYMLFDTRMFKAGKVGYLITPKVHLGHTSVVEFHWYSTKSRIDFISELAVYVANEVGLAERRVGVVSVLTPGIWNHLRLPIDLEPGDYQLVFRATCSQPSENYFAVDTINVWQASPGDEIKYHSAPGRPVGRCTFTKFIKLSYL